MRVGAGWPDLPVPAILETNTVLIHAILLTLQAASNAHLGDVMSLPDGFVAIPVEFAGGRDVVACWTGEGSQSSQGAFVLCVQRIVIGPLNVRMVVMRRRR